MDIKEAVHPVAPKHPGAKIPKNHAERVASGAWHMSPALGNRILAAALHGRPVFLRELLPQDLKFEIEHLDQKEAMRVAKFLGTVVGKAHARQLEMQERKAWLHELQKRDNKRAPSWLWTNVVTLLVEHENAYLNHCHAVAYGRLRNGLLH